MESRADGAGSLRRQVVNPGPIPTSCPAVSGKLKEATNTHSQPVADISSQLEPFSLSLPSGEHYQSVIVSKGVETRFSLLVGHTPSLLSNNCMVNLISGSQRSWQLPSGKHLTTSGISLVVTAWGLLLVPTGWGPGMLPDSLLGVGPPLGYLPHDKGLAGSECQ